MNARDKSYDESLDAVLRNPAEAAAYLEAVIEIDDPAALLLALRQVAKAHGTAEVTRRAELQPWAPRCLACQQRNERRVQHAAP